MDGQKITRTVKKKFQRFDKAGKSVKDFLGVAVPIVAGVFITQATQNVVNPKEANFVDDGETESIE